MKRKFLRCSSLVNPNAVKRETIDGVEHIVVSSFTMPSNIVMNGVMYPADEIDKSFIGLNRTLAPVEHPTNGSGQFVSASDPEAIHRFHAGAFNDNAEKVGNRIRVDKVINVQEALKSERGRRLLDRINELETSKDPRPIHTSTGIFLEVEELSEPKTNADGQEYRMIARNMLFDHDAILLDSVGAAQPHQGVGMAVNRSGQQVETETVMLTNDNNGLSAAPRKLSITVAQLGAVDGMSDDDKKAITEIVDAYFEQNQDGLSYRNILEQLRPQAERAISHEWLWVEDLFEDVAILETDMGYFEVSYRVDDGVARLTGVPVAVDRVISYQSKTNAMKGDVMRDMIINALKAVGKYEEGMSDEDALAAYNALMIASNADANGGEGDGGDEENGDGGAAAIDGDAITQAVTNAIKPLQDQVSALEGRLNADTDAKTAGLIKTIVNSKKYPGLDEAALKAVPIENLKSMAVNCGGGHGLPLQTNDGDAGADVKTAPTDMPE